MSDSLVIACKQANFEECLQLALSHNTGLEIQAFAQPDLLDGNWQAEARRVKQRLAAAGFKGLLSTHGAFLDLVSASPDRKVVALAKERYLASLKAAHELGAKYVVFHANYIATIRMPIYREQWTKRQIDFWGDLSKRAAQLGITILLENMWEYDPAIIGDVLDAVASPNLRACIDVGHTQLFSNVILDNWLERVQDHLVYTHLNNNPGGVDHHQALGDGSLDYMQILATLRALPKPPVFCLEIERVEDIVRSLPYFELAQAEKA